MDIMWITSSILCINQLYTTPYFNISRHLSFANQPFHTPLKQHIFNIFIFILLYYKGQRYFKMKYTSLYFPFTTKRDTLKHKAEVLNCLILLDP